MKNIKKILLIAVLCLSIFSISGCGKKDDVTQAFNDTNKFLHDNIEITLVGEDQAKMKIYEIKNKSDYNFVKLPVSVLDVTDIENSYTLEKTPTNYTYSSERYELNIPSKQTIYTKTNCQEFIDNFNKFSIVLGANDEVYKKLITNQKKFNEFVESHITKEKSDMDFINVSIDYVGPTDFELSDQFSLVEGSKRVHTWKLTNNTDKEVILNSYDISAIGGDNSFFNVECEGTVYQETTITIPANGSIELDNTSDSSAKLYVLTQLSNYVSG